MFSILIVNSGTHNFSLLLKDQTKVRFAVAYMCSGKDTSLLHSRNDGAKDSGALFVFRNFDKTNRMQSKFFLRLGILVPRSESSFSSLWSRGRNVLM